MRAGFSYKVKYVHHTESERGPITTFQIGTKDKNTGEWTNFKVVVWSKLDVEDGDQVKIKSILGVDMPKFKNRNDEIVQQCQLIAIVEKTEKKGDNYDV